MVSTTPRKTRATHDQIKAIVEVILDTSVKVAAWQKKRSTAAEKWITRNLHVPWDTIIDQGSPLYFLAN